jgi:hypothetical protein
MPNHLIPYLCAILASLAAAFAGMQAQRAITDQERAADERRSQLCVVFQNEYENDRRELAAIEKAHREDHDSLRIMRHYLRRIHGTAEAHTELNQLLRRVSLPRLKSDLRDDHANIERARREALDSRPPEFCR